MNRKRKAMSLVELLVVISIIGILIALLLPCSAALGCGTGCVVQEQHAATGTGVHAILRYSQRRVSQMRRRQEVDQAIVDYDGGTAFGAERCNPGLPAGSIRSAAARCKRVELRDQRLHIGARARLHPQSEQAARRRPKQ